MLAMTGMALVAGATFASGPAAASTSTAQGTTSATQSTQQQAKSHGGREWVAGYYRTRMQCERVGRIGERFDRWDDYDCERVRRGFRPIWRLEVERDWHGGGHWDGHNGGHWDGDDHHGGGHWNHGPRR
jgi:hypothetical protein